MAYPLFQAGGGGASPTSALQLRIEAIDYRSAADLNALWHSLLPKVSAKVGLMDGGLYYGAEFGGLWYAAAVWSAPVSPQLPRGECLELRRFAVGPDAPRNTASRMLAVMARMIRKAEPGVRRLVSYQDTAVHAGTIYRAAGWSAVTTGQRSRSWDRPGPGRHRPPATTAGVKVRWEKELCKA